MSVLRSLSTRGDRVKTLDSQSSFIKGLNLSAAPFQMDRRELRRAENCRLDPFGGVTKRWGVRYAMNLPIAGGMVQGGFGWTTSTTQQMVIVGGRLYTAPYSPNILWTAQGVPGDFNAAAFISFAAFRDIATECVYIADGGALNKWNGATVSTNIVNTPNVSHVWVYNRRLWGIGTDRVYWSALDNGDSLGSVVSGGGEAVIRTFGQSDLVTGGSLKASSMLIHKGGISRFTGWSQDDIAIQAGTQGVSSDVGTIFSRSFIAIENAAFFLSDRGFYLLTEGGVTSISRQLDPLLGTFDFSLANKVCVGHHKQFREIWWYLPGIGALTYNYEVRAWSGPQLGFFFDNAITAFWDTVDENNKPLLLAGLDTGAVARVDAPSTTRDGMSPAGIADGTVVTMVAECHPFFAGTPITTKAWRWAYVNAQLHGSTAAELAMDTATGYNTRPISGLNLGPVWTPPASWDPTSGVWGGQANVMYRVPLGYQGVFLHISLIDGSDAVPPTFNQVDVLGFDLGLR